MLRSRFGFILLAALMLSGGSVLAEDNNRSANSVMHGCRSLVDGNDHDDFLAGVCLGLIWAIDDWGQVDKLICRPAVTNEQMARVVVQYIDARPARMHETFFILALEALTAAWPCKR
jgi:Rap1a immunity proteins